ncbi:30S ribosomal protein S27ae [Candidatus Woesearchaeota archaeon]|nr:30S ribosomal protein S27ae [Candidatus Woesearchaeota archaeon]
MPKKQRKPKKTSAKYKLYKVSGNKLEKSKFCPKCGAGVFLARHNNRETCGKCGYTEMISKKEEKKK